MKRKLTSRKFWVTVANFTSQVLYLFNFADTKVERVTSLILAGGALIAYVIGEGLADSSDNELIEDNGQG